MDNHEGSLGHYHAEATALPQVQLTVDRIKTQ